MSITPRKTVKGTTTYEVAVRYKKFGRKVQTSKRGFRTHKEAEIYQAKLYEQIKRYGQPLNCDKLTLKAVYDEFMQKEKNQY